MCVISIIAFLSKRGMILWPLDMMIAKTSDDCCYMAKSMLKDLKSGHRNFTVLLLIMFTKAKYHTQQRFERAAMICVYLRVGVVPIKATVYFDAVLISAVCKTVDRV